MIELLTGEPPYFDLAPMPALFRIVQDDHPPLPPDISSVCIFTSPQNKKFQIVSLISYKIYA